MIFLMFCLFVAYQASNCYNFTFKHMQFLNLSVSVLLEFCDIWKL